MEPSIGNKNHFLPLCVSGGFWQSWSHVWMQVWVCCVYPKRSLIVYFLQINLSWYLYQPFLHISVLIYLHVCIALVCELVIMFPWMYARIFVHILYVMYLLKYYNAHIIWVNLQRSQIITSCCMWVFKCVCARVHVHVLLCVSHGVIIVGYNSSVCYQWSPAIMEPEHVEDHLLTYALTSSCSGIGKQ